METEETQERYFTENTESKLFRKFQIKWAEYFPAIEEQIMEEIVEDDEIDLDHEEKKDLKELKRVIQNF